MTHFPQQVRSDQGESLVAPFAEQSSLHRISYAHCGVKKLAQKGRATYCAKATD